MRNRRKILLRDHSVPEVTLKTCQRCYSVSAVPETLTVWGPKGPPRTLVTDELRCSAFPRSYKTGYSLTYSISLYFFRSISSLFSLASRSSSVSVSLPLPFPLPQPLLAGIFRILFNLTRCLRLCNTCRSKNDRFL